MFCFIECDAVSDPLGYAARIEVPRSASGRLEDYHEQRRSSVKVIFLYKFMNVPRIFSNRTLQSGQEECTLRLVITESSWTWMSFQEEALTVFWFEVVSTSGPDTVNELRQD